MSNATVLTDRFDRALLYAEPMSHARCRPSPEQLESRGGGWVAEEGHCRLLCLGGVQQSAPCRPARR